MTSRIYLNLSTVKFVISKKPASLVKTHNVVINTNTTHVDLPITLLRHPIFFLIYPIYNRLGSNNLVAEFARGTHKTKF